MSVISEEQHAALIAEEKANKRFWWTIAIVGVILLIGGLSAWMFWDDVKAFKEYWHWALLVPPVVIFLIYYGSTPEVSPLENADSESINMIEDEGKFTRLLLCAIFHSLMACLLWFCVDYFIYELEVEDVLHGPARVGKTFWLLVILYSVSMSIINTFGYLKANKIGHIALFGSQSKWLKFKNITPGIVCYGLPLYLATLFRTVDFKNRIVKLGEIEGQPTVKFSVITPLGETFWTTQFSWCPTDSEVYFTQTETEWEKIGAKIVAEGVRYYAATLPYQSINELMAIKEQAAIQVKKDVFNKALRRGIRINYIINSNVEPDPKITAALAKLEADKIGEGKNVLDSTTLREEARKMVDESNGKLDILQALNILQGEFGTARRVTFDGGDGKGILPILPLQDQKQ